VLRFHYLLSRSCIVTILCLVVSPLISKCCNFVFSSHLVTTMLFCSYDVLYVRLQSYCNSYFFPSFLISVFIGRVAAEPPPRGAVTIVLWAIPTGPYEAVPLLIFSSFSNAEQFVVPTFSVATHWVDDKTARSQAK
jgi:hypothetical protein